MAENEKRSEKTVHRIFFGDSGKMADVAPESVDLVVTSPPYPMIQMWDDLFEQRNPAIGTALQKGDGNRAFELMHRELDPVWKELWRVMKKGGIVCVNIGDAVRTVNEKFALYTNHSRITSQMLKLGFSALPVILWRKQTNAPNKFMGSGMLPPGAYVTLEHEYILIYRKGGIRSFDKKEKINRRESSYFWEERNVWFSDVWMDIKGARQKLFAPDARKRSAAFPFEIPYRLINMFSVKGDTVLDPFLGIGTTMYAAMASCRNSTGYEIEKKFENEIFSNMDKITNYSNKRIDERLENHRDFVRKRLEDKKAVKHTNEHYGFPVVTMQEKGIVFNKLVSVEKKDGYVLEAVYSQGEER